MYLALVLRPSSRRYSRSDMSLGRREWTEMDGGIKEIRPLLKEATALFATVNNGDGDVAELQTEYEGPSILG